tara:strand:+ start:3267 stop:3470 length:204 start_codon:yes stop_codon:yes gene_type:complete
MINNIPTSLEEFKKLLSNGSVRYCRYCDCEIDISHLPKEEWETISWCIACLPCLKKHCGVKIINGKK